MRIKLFNNPAVLVMVWEPLSQQEGTIGFAYPCGVHTSAGGSLKQGSEPSSF